jgi:hypothetical protein
MTDALLDIADARIQIDVLDERLRDEQVIWVAKGGKKAFALVDAELMERLLETLDVLEDDETMRMIAASEEDVRSGRIVDHAKVKAELG